MALSEHVSMTITSANVGVARAGFGVPLILSCNAAFSERVRAYQAIEDVAADFPTTSPEYLAANAMFSQEPAPEQIMIGRAVGKPTMAYRVDVVAAAAGDVYELDVAGQGVTATTVSYTALSDITFTTTHGTETFNAVAHGMSTGDGPFRLTNSGGGLPTGTSIDTNYWIISLTADTFQLAASRADAIAETEILITSDGTGTHTLRRSTNDVIVAQLVQGLNDVVGNNYTAAQTGSSGSQYATVTADSAGAWFSLAAWNLDLLRTTMTHAEPATTIATDLAAIRAVNDTWYALYTLYNSEAVVEAAAAAIEPLTKIYAADISDSLTATLADGGSDLQDDLQDFNYDRTFTVFHPDASQMCGAAWLGTRLPLSPGAATWKFAQPDGVTAVDVNGTQSLNLVAKNANFLQTTAGIDSMREGVMVGGEYIDVIRDLDYLKDDIQKSVYEVLVNALKVPYTMAGILVIVNALRGALRRAVELGIIDSDFTISYPTTIASISASKRALRTLPDIKFSCRLQGAIHRVEVTGVVSV